MVKAVFHMSVGENSGFPRVEEAPMTTGLNLLAQEVENASGVDQEDSELVDNTLALVLAKPKTFVLPSQVVSQIVMAMNILRLTLCVLLAGFC